jgi:hypothetical protein
MKVDGARLGLPTVPFGHASAAQAKDRKSGVVVALKLYRMHKLNEISSHQVAREVGQ